MQPSRRQSSIAAPPVVAALVAVGLFVSSDQDAADAPLVLSPTLFVSLPASSPLATVATPPSVTSRVQTSVFAERTHSVASLVAFVAAVSALGASARASRRFVARTNFRVNTNPSGKVCLKASSEAKEAADEEAKAEAEAEETSAATDAAAKEVGEDDVEDDEDDIFADQDEEEVAALGYSEDDDDEFFDEEDGEPLLEAKCKARYLRGSPQKFRRVLWQIRGRSYRDALMMLEFMPWRQCKPVLKALQSAAANAQNHFNMDKSRLYISRCHAFKAPGMKRARPHSKGGMRFYVKHFAHVHVHVAEKQEEYA